MRQTVELAHAILVHYHGLETNGQLTQADAKYQAAAAVRQLRYSGSEYFWINDLHPTMVMHPNSPDLEGKDLSDYKSPSGQLIFVDFANQVKNSGEGFVPYIWPKPVRASRLRKSLLSKGSRPGLG